MLFSENLLVPFSEISHVIFIFYLGLLTGKLPGVMGLKENIGQESKYVHGKLSISELWLQI